MDCVRLRTKWVLLPRLPGIDGLMGLCSRREVLWKVLLQAYFCGFFRRSDLLPLLISGQGSLRM